MIWQTEKRKKWLTIMLLMLCALLVSVWFYATYAHTTADSDPYYDESWEPMSEALVMGRIYQMQLSLSDQNPQGFLSQYAPQSGEHSQLRTRRAYLADGDVTTDTLVLYTSGIGAQGTLQGAANLALCALRISAINRYRVLRFFAILFFFALLMFIAVWIQKELGGMSGAAAFCALMLSPWVEKGVFNLYWLFWTYLAPMAAAIILCRAIEKNGRAKWWQYALLGGTLLLKFSFGFEFVSTLLICMEMPVIYYVAKHWSERRPWLRLFFITGGIGIGSFAAAFFILVAKLGTHLGSFTAGLQGVLSNVAFRTGAFLENPHETLLNGAWSGLDASAGKVVWRFLWDNEMLSGLSMGTITLLYLALIVVLVKVVVLCQKSEARQVLARHAKPMLVVAFSYLAPISWYVLARGHSMVHTHIAHFIWLFPTMIFVAAHAAACVRDIAAALRTVPRQEDVGYDI